MLLLFFGCTEDSVMTTTPNEPIAMGPYDAFKLMLNSHKNAAHHLNRILSPAFMEIYRDTAVASPLLQARHRRVVGANFTRDSEVLDYTLLVGLLGTTENLPFFYHALEHDGDFFLDCMMETFLEYEDFFDCDQHEDPNGSFVDIVHYTFLFRLAMTPKYWERSGATEFRQVLEYVTNHYPMDMATRGSIMLTFDHYGTDHMVIEESIH